MAETFDKITSRASEILQLLDDVSASLENTLLAHGKDMTPADLQARTKRCKEARQLCDELLRSEDPDRTYQLAIGIGGSDEGFEYKSFEVLKNELKDRVDQLTEADLEDEVRVWISVED